MEIVILPDTTAIGSLAADAIEAWCSASRRGAGPGHRLVTAGHLRRAGRPVRRRPGVVSPQARGFTLDEYVGLPADHPETYRNVIHKDFVDRVDFAPGAVRGPGRAGHRHPRRSAPATRTAIADAGGVDLQILGIGTVGHIGFNEPGSSLASRTRIKTLTRQTRIDNARFFGGDVDAVPTHCLTQGLGTIMSARHVVLVATGARQGRGGAPPGRGRGERDVAGHRPAAPPARHGPAGRRRRQPAAVGRLLPPDLPGQAGLAGHLIPVRPLPEPRVNPVRPPTQVDHGELCSAIGVSPVCRAENAMINFVGASKRRPNPC